MSETLEERLLIDKWTPREEAAWRKLGREAAAELSRLRAEVEAKDVALHSWETITAPAMKSRALAAEQALAQAREWRPIETAPNDNSFRWYGLRVQHASGHEWFEAHYVQHDDDGQMRLPSGDDFTDWAFSDFEVWCDAPPLPSEPVNADGGAK